MLNRLYIVIGLLAILAIAGGFAIPLFVDAETVRVRVEEAATEALGQRFAIGGEVEFSLLPQPRVVFTDAIVGDSDQPAMTIGEVRADLSLFDFLRDHFLITKLVLERPVLDVRVDVDGHLDLGAGQPTPETGGRRMTLSGTEIADGVLRVVDARSGTTLSATGIAGTLQSDLLRGPLSFQGTGQVDGVPYSGRMAVSAIDANGVLSASMFVEPSDGSFSFTTEGQVETGADLSYTGTVSYRQRPPAPAPDADRTDAGRGDLLMTSEVRASTAKVLFDRFTITPDENRPSARLAGTADVHFGATNRFGVVILNGILSLPPRDATADPSAMPYELIRLLAEIPTIPVPPLPGRVSMSVPEVGLRDVALRDVTLDASTDGKRWVIEEFSGSLASGARLTVDGAIENVDGRPGFAGNARVETGNLHPLVRLWRRPADGNPLVNVDGSLTARLSLVGETLSIFDGVLGIGEASHPFEVEIGFAPAARHLHLNADIGALDQLESKQLFATLPDIGTDGRFGMTFPNGRFALSAERATVAGLEGRGLEAAATWEGGVLSLEKLAASSLGGVGLDATLTAFGTVAKPELSGRAAITVPTADAPALTMLYDVVGTPAPIRRRLARSMPAELEFELGAPSGEGGQSLEATGRLGAGDLTLNAELGLGLVNALRGQMSVRLELKSDDPQALARQLGLGEVALTGAPARLVAVVSGTAANSFESTVRLEGGADSLAFSGNVVAGDLSRVTGNGNLQVALADASGLVEALGMGGLWLPPLSGSARIDFAGSEQVRLSGINGASGGTGFSGEFEWTRTGQAGAVAGNVRLAALDPTGLALLFGGPAAAQSLEGQLWPDGPVQPLAGPRTTTGRVSVQAEAISSAGTTLATDATFTLQWDATTGRMREFSAAIGGGTLTGELSVCCAGPLPQMQVSGRLALDDVRFASIVPSATGAGIAATVDAAARFATTGDSVASALSAMTGEGSYTLTGLEIEAFNPGAFGVITSFDTVIDMEPELVSALVAESLETEGFTSPAVSGGFTIAGGVLRSPNLAIDGDGARVFGSTGIRFADLGLSGGFAMSPTSPTGPNGILTEANAQIVANLGGTLLEPVRTFDVSGMVDTIMVEAYEIEVARLERLRAADEARQRAAAAERARLAAEQEAKRRAEEERLAAEAEARRRAEEEAAAEAEPQLQPGFNLNFQPATPNQF